MDKILVVIGVGVVTELATGDLINQITFGYYTENTPEIVKRIPTIARENFPGKQIGLAELILFLKADEVVYKVGSKWHLRIHKNGTVNLAAVE
jgi:hypothetical protein